jgi:hypothetical protein
VRRAAYSTSRWALGSSPVSGSGSEREAGKSKPSIAAVAPPVTPSAAATVAASAPEAARSGEVYVSDRPLKMQELPCGAQYKDIILGSGPAPVAGQSVSASDQEPPLRSFAPLYPFSPLTPTGPCHNRFCVSQGLGQWGVSGRVLGRAWLSGGERETCHLPLLFCGLVSQIAVHYTCLIVETDAILDTTYRPGEPVVTTLGSG